MLPEPSSGSVIKAVTLTGKALNKWRRHNEVHSLKRELKKALFADHRVPPADRESLRDQVDKWLFDPTFLGGLSIYVEDADRSPLPEIQARLRDLIKLTDPADVPVVAAIVVETIENSVTRAKRSDRRAAYHESRAAEQRVIERIGGAQEGVVERLDRMDEAHQRRFDQQDLMIRRLLEQQEGKVPEADAPPTPSGVEVPRDPEDVLDALDARDHVAAERLRAAWEARDGSLGRLIEDETSWLQEAHADVWEATGRLLAEGGQFMEAEQAYVAAVDRGHGDPIRQLARASSAAAIRGDDERAQELLALARGSEGGEDHPAVALREIEALDDSQEMLRRLDLVAPTSPREEAAREVLRARA
ncbi:MAG: hypothetical protein M3459_10735, partial [Actinomycetota bacterium]|nr:hypothetical protein [Actinomycetota bacterium]